MVRTRIIATIGPASGNETVLRKMFHSGLDIVRLNFSHGTHTQHLRNIRLVKNMNKKQRRAVKIMQDLEGYRIRVGKLAKPVELKKRTVFYLTQDNTINNKKDVSFDYTGSLKRIKNGTLVYIDDGKIVLKVIGKGKNRLKVQVITGGILMGNKGINIPGVKLDFSALTEKDRKDVEVGIENKVDYIAQSFVSKREDIKLLRGLVKPRHPSCRIYAKVESRDAIENIDGIIDEADGIIVARGDLGICVPIYKVPVIQKEVIKKCRLRGKPVIVATQMLESMREEELPTRAEVSDVANAILDGADGLLLSAETAIGKHPHKAVCMMNNIIKSTESYKKKLKNLMV